MKIAIISREHKTLIDVFKMNLKNVEVLHFLDYKKVEKNFDLIINLDKPLEDYEALTCKYSLLPAFKNSEDEVKDAIISGVKVTGITIYYQKSKRIIAQYPIFITNELHYDNLLTELEYLEQTLFPIIVEKILNNEYFEVKTLINKKNCEGSCGNCSGGCSSCQH